MCVCVFKAPRSRSRSRSALVTPREYRLTSLLKMPLNFVHQNLDVEMIRSRREYAHCDQRGPDTWVLAKKIINDNSDLTLICNPS